MTEGHLLQQEIRTLDAGLLGSFSNIGRVKPPYDAENPLIGLCTVKILHNWYCYDCGVKIPSLKVRDAFQDIGENWVDIHLKSHRK